MKIETEIIKKLLSTILFVGAVALVGIPQDALAQTELTTTFTNDTGRRVNDLHIKYTHDVSITQNPKTFKKVSGTNLKKLTDGLVDLNESIEITAKRASGDIDINEWWWTLDGEQQGDVHKGCAAPSCTRSGAAGTPASFATDTLEGIVTVEMKTAQGPVKLRLPADMRAGDTISGTVVDERKDANDDAAAIEINGQLHKLSNRILTFIVPKAGLVYPFILKNSSGREIGRGAIPKSFVPGIGPNIANAGTNVVGQTGRNLAVAGNFDGIADTTHINIGNRPAEFVAESPTITVFGIPNNAPTGQSVLTVNENAANRPSNSQSAITVASVKLTADKLNLTRGEQAVATMTVDVGQNPKSTIPVQVSCNGAVNMQGGNLQTIQIQPSQVNPDGTFTQTFPLTATQAGTFNIKATVTQPNPTTGPSKCECKCEFATPAIITAGKRDAAGGGTENSFEPKVKTSCNGNKCEVQSIAYSWSVGAGSTATYSVHAGTDKVKKLVVDVTKSGTLELTVTVTVTCSDGSTCTSTGSKTFDVKK